MTAPWIVAFVALAGVVIAVAVILLGVLRRLIPVLERMTQLTTSQVGFGAAVGTPVNGVRVYDASGVEHSLAWDDGYTRVALFISSGCESCGALGDELKQTAESLDGVALFVFSDTPNSEYSREIERARPLLYDLEGIAVAAFANRAVPQAYVVDGTGRVVARDLVHSIAELRQLITQTREGVRTESLRLVVY